MASDLSIVDQDAWLKNWHAKLCGTLFDPADKTDLVSGVNTGFSQLAMSSSSYSRTGAVDRGRDQCLDRRVRLYRVLE